MSGFMYFKDSGIKGEAIEGISESSSLTSPNDEEKENFYYEWIELRTVSQTVTRAIESGRSGTVRARAGTVLEEVEVTKELDTSTTGLLGACSGGTPFPEVYIHLCTSVADREGKSSLHPYLEFRLFGVKVTSYNINASGLDGGEIPTETIKLNFDKITWSYWPIGPIPDKPDVDPNFIHPVSGSGWDVLRSAPYSG